jgi:hypothetical protein
MYLIRSGLLALLSRKTKLASKDYGVAKTSVLISLRVRRGGIWAGYFLTESFLPV